MAVPTASQVTGVANTLLHHAGLRRSVHGIEQCGSVLFAQLYEALTGSRPPGGGESEAQRCQAVVDAFSEQLSPHISLDHISGGDLAARDPLTIVHLLDIFSVFFHLPSVKERTRAGTDRDGTNFISAEGLSIVSEVLQEELGPAHSHTHFSHSYSTDSTAELLRPVPRSHLPLLHPPLPSHSHSSHSPPSLTITSLTCSTIAEQPSPAEPAAFEERTVSSGETSVLPRAGEGAPDRTEQPVGPKIGQAGSETVAHTTPPPSTPPLSQKRLLSSPLHHSTPRTLVSRSRVFPGRDTVRHTPSPPSLQSPSSPSFPFPKVTSSPPHPLPTSTETDSASSVSDGEHEGDSVTGAHTTVTVATQTQEEAASTAHLPHPATESLHHTLVEETPSVSVPGQLSRNAAMLDSDSEHDSTNLYVPKFHSKRGTVKFSLPPTHGSPPNRTGKKTEEVRREVLASLYKRYLKELRATYPKPSNKTKHRPALMRGRKPLKRSGVPKQPRPPGRRGRELEKEEEEEGENEEEEELGEQTQPRPEKLGVTSDLFPLVEASLPVCPVATETVRHLWRKQLQQITAITNPPHQHPHNISQITEMERKHTALLEAVKKEIDHTRRMHGQQEAKAQQRAVRSQLQAKRQAAARARRYFNDYELRLKAKLQKKRTNEEQVFRRVFEDGLAILREREQELRRFAREKRDNQRERQKQQLEAMEQYYRDKFSMLAESLARERVKATVRDKAQNQLVEQLRRELRERLEGEVRQLQDCLDRDDDVTHFRELDAQQLRLALHHLTPSP